LGFNDALEHTMAWLEHLLIAPRAPWGEKPVAGSRLARPTRRSQDHTDAVLFGESTVQEDFSAGLCIASRTHTTQSSSSNGNGASQVAKDASGLCASTKARKRRTLS
jgi:hypothetical protein